MVVRSMKRACLVAIAAVALALQAGAEPRFDDSAPDALSIANGHYVASFRKSDGALASIVDAGTGRTLVHGGRDGCLWIAVDRIASCAYRAGGADGFSYAWSPAAATLTMDYAPAAGKADGVKARVVVTASADARLDFAIEVESAGGTPLDEIRFPAGIALRDSEVKGVLVPLLPGVVVGPGFFAANRTWIAKYPGEGLFADFVAAETTGGSFALYEVPDGKLRPAWLGIAHGTADDESLLVHAFAPRLVAGQRFVSPTMRLRVGAGFVGSALAWRDDAGIGRVASLESRAGAVLGRLVRAPFLKLDMEEMRRPFADFEPVLRALHVPSVVHFTGYGVRGFDEDYPDFLPPNPTHGTTEEFASFVAKARGLGHLTMPYTNPTWWDDEGPTLSSLPAPLTVRDVAVIDDEVPRYETYGKRGGYAVSPWHPFVSSRADARVREVVDELGCDLLFEDQIGARPWLFDRNPASPSPTAYVDGWIDHARRHSAALLGTEAGFDRLLGHEIGFFGCITPDGDGWASERFGEGNWEIFPFAALTARDKAFFYFHNMGANPVTTANFRMALATGTFPVFPLYEPPHNIFNTGRGGGLDRDELRVASVLQRYVLSRYATERATSYATLAEGVTRTGYPSVEVIANGTKTLEQPEGRVVAGGALVRAVDGSLVAGLFATWRGLPLTGGARWIVEERDASGVTLRMPSGNDTPIVVRPLAGWSASTQLEVRAIGPRGDLVRTLPWSWTAYGPLFTATRWLDGREVAEWRVVDGAREPRRRGVRR